MLSQNQIKFIRSLQQKKFRKEHGLFLVEGEKMVDELLQTNWKLRYLCYTDEKYAGVSITGELIAVSEKTLGRISSQQHPHKALAVVEMQDVSSFHLDSTDHSLVLDGLQDPGNLGTIIRTADWFGIHTIYCSPATVDVYNPKVVQATMGSLFRVQVIYVDLDLLFQQAEEQQVPVWGTVLDGENLYRVEKPMAGLWVIGNEANGISPAVQARLNQKVRIPSYPENGPVESLNASIATALLCQELRRP